MPFSDQQAAQLQLAIRITSVLSILGSSSIIFTYSAFERFRNQMNTIVVFMSVADLLSSMNTFAGDWPRQVEEADDSALFCTVQGFNIQLFFLSAVLWTGCMATHCLLAVMLSKPISALQPYYKYYHLVSWGVPLAIACFTFALEPLLGLGRVYEPLGVWCWISPNYSIWRLVLFYGPIWLVFLYNVTAYSIIGIKLYQLSRPLAGSAKHGRRSSRHTGRFVTKTLVYMIAFVVNWVCSTGNRVQNLVSPEHPIYWLAFSQAVTLPLQGALNAIIYFCFAVFLDHRKEQEDSSVKLEYSSSSESPTALDSFDSGVSYYGGNTPPRLSKHTWENVDKA